ncbi:hypothetical protein [Rhizobium sp. SL42]|uniref:hypothetical protein n=1 Tax=Rhizobium sp. SL42 TaxID=2806346 RepID=UPI001F3ED824|nr:hypothetical protein [Rhizobium sp. SL42]UJW76139.1 hypothetical protein IM739_06550 [Rhizobium sp. SL42]
MVEIYAAMAFEAARARHARNPRLEEEAFYQAYRESWWSRLRRGFGAWRQKQPAELSAAKLDWCCDGLPAK